MATNLELDDDLIQESLAMSHQSTKKAVVTEALQEYIQRRRQQEFLTLFNTIEYDASFNYKEQRQIK